MILGRRNDADNLDRSTPAAAFLLLEAPPDRGRRREELLRHRFVHDRDARRRACVAVVEVPAGKEGNPERCEVIVAHGVCPGECVVLRLRGEALRPDHFIPRRVADRRNL